MLRVLLALTIVWTQSLQAQDKLVILSPHRQSIQREFIPEFKSYYESRFNKSIDVEWIDQGGTSDDVRFLKARFAVNPKTSGMDIFWGGGSTVFSELAIGGFLAPYELSSELKKQVPQSMAGVALYDDSREWYGSAVSSFGIFFNKPALKFWKLEEPKTWADLSKPEYFGNISITDPRRSGSANTMNTIILQALGWKEGWKLLTLMGANARSFTHSSTDPIKSVITGDAAISLAIDFYALAQVGEFGEENLGFVMPEGQTVLDPDPIAIVKGAPNRESAERFVEFILSSEAQKLLVLPRKALGGPKFSSLGRMSVNTKTYELTEGKRSYDFNPFKQNAYMELDNQKARRLQRTFNDLVGAVLVDNHHQLKKAWQAMIERGEAGDKELIEKLTAPVVSEQEFEELASRWGDDVLRNQTINSWVEAARSKYQSIASKP